MKKLIVLLLITTVVNFSQSWNSIVETDIPTPSFNSKIDLFSNKDGINVVVQNPYPTSNLKYYLLNSSGTTIRTYTFESQAVEFANISGDNDKVYIVYKLGNDLVTRKSTNAGQNWSNIADIEIGENTCNNVDIVFDNDDNVLHVVWATQDDKDDYKTYYRKLSSDTWSSTEEVTDGSNVGGFPTVSNSEDRVHVSYNTGQSSDPAVNLGDANTRDKYTSSWQTPQSIYSSSSFRERVHAGSSKLFDFYYKLETGMGQ